MAAYFEVDDQDVYTEQNEKYFIACPHWSSEESRFSVGKESVKISSPSSPGAALHKPHGSRLPEKG